MILAMMREERRYSWLAAEHCVGGTEGGGEQVLILVMVKCAPQAFCRREGPSAWRRRARAFRWRRCSVVLLVTQWRWRAPRGKVSAPHGRLGSAAACAFVNKRRWWAVLACFGDDKDQLFACAAEQRCCTIVILINEVATIHVDDLDATPG